MRRRRQRRNRQLEWLGWVILGIIVVPLLFIPISYGLGWRFDIISGTSMEPAYYRGGLVIARPVVPETVKVGDIVLFRITVDNVSGFVCHRVIEINTTDKELSFQTKGDNNEYPDGDPVSVKDLAGKEAVYVPKVGEVIRFYRSTITLMGRRLLAGPLLIGVIGIVIIGVEFNSIYDWAFRREAMKRKERLQKRRRR